MFQFCLPKLLRLEINQRKIEALIEINRNALVHPRYVLPPGVLSYFMWLGLGFRFLGVWVWFMVLSCGDETKYWDESFNKIMQSKYLI